jgi:hypothetical protein
VHPDEGKPGDRLDGEEDEDDEIATGRELVVAEDPRSVLAEEQVPAELPPGLAGLFAVRRDERRPAGESVAAKSR